ncbi:hypothetical protein C8R41DRAFT_28864 [Lentinula lateritia]|uniref:Uncharacterized protein n=1 Tax=Lentinula lateritia TaxID=40482 RepID=A0ABQ8VT84_9AGAR|nr:hypothetical protein C8R41DRAFT_28864 [Lentinula lateritia]
MSEAAQTIFSTYEQLRQTVDRALHTQIGNYAQLRIHEQSCLDLSHQVEQFRDYLGGNYTIYQQSLTQMIEDLHSAADTPEDQPDIPGPSFGPSLARPTSERRGRGRPRKSIDPTQLETLSRSRNTREAVGIIFECSGRTIRRRLVDLGLSPAGQPVCQTQQLQDGSYVQEYHPGVSSDLSQLSDNDLDILIQNIHTQFPSFGRRMIDGYLLQSPL